MVDSKGEIALARFAAVLERFLQVVCQLGRVQFRQRSQQQPQHLLMHLQAQCQQSESACMLPRLGC